ncbi:cation:proton antiporter [Candidatus Saccharibacteria bacterium]|nr:cation:proton antiporter [Candidatus Saccharibacteria bacterium]
MDEVFFGLSLIIAIGTAVAMFMRSIGQPLIIGHIITGIIVGPALLQISNAPDTLTFFGEIGIAFLLFIIGLGMNPRVVAEVGRASFIVATVQIATITAIGWFICTALGLSSTEALIVALGLSVNSTIVALKLLSDRKEQGRLYGKLTIGILLVEDIAAAIALIVIASAKDGQWLELNNLGALAFKGLVVGSAMYWISRHVLPKFQKLIAGEQELLFLFAIAWGLGGASLLAKAGFSLEIGALAAGVFLASMPYAQEIAARLRPLRDFFVIIFFITLGTKVSFSYFSEYFWVMLAAVFTVVAIKPLILLTTLGVLGYTKRTSFKTSLALTNVSEFSIIFAILAVSQGLIDQPIVSLLTIIALISIAVSTYLVTFGDRLYVYASNYLNMFERRKAQGDVKPDINYELVLFGYQRGGHEFVSLFKKLRKKYVVIDYDPEIIDILIHRKINYLYGDATDVELLEEAGVERARLVVSTIPDFQVNAYLLDHLKHKNPRAVVIVHADDPLEAAKYYQAGASYVVLPHYIGSEKVSEFIGKSGLAKSAFTKQRQRHLDYLEKHYGALEKLNEVHKKKLGHAIVSGMAALTKTKT